MVKTASESDPPALNGASTKTQKIGTPTNRRYWRVATRAIWVGLGVHAMFIALFYAIGATFLAVVNVGSVFIDAVCIVLLRRKRNMPVILLVWIEVVGHYTRVRKPERTVSVRRTPHNVGRFLVSY